MNQINQKKVIIICGTPTIRLQEVEEGGVPLTSSLKQLLKTQDDTPVHIPYPGVGPVTLATFLSKNGIQVEVKDWYTDPINILNYDIIGISGTHLDFDHLQKIVIEARKSNPAAIIVVGGPVTLTYALDFLLGKMPEINYVVFNEGEETFLELIRAIENNTAIANIKGIGYRGSNGCVKTPLRKPLDPDEICIPEWSFIDLKKKVPLLSLETARGCTYNCAYCFEVNFWGKPVRFRKPEIIIEELKRNYQKFGITTYRLADSCFTAPESRCMEICDQIIHHFTNVNIPIRWSCYARINNLDNKLLKKMNQAGCIAICVGMESGDANILKNMNKPYSSDQIVRGITNAREAGIITHCNIITGFPGETADSIANTIATLNAAKPDTYHCMTLDIAPDTTIAKNKSLFKIKGDRLEWQHETMSNIEAKTFIYKIMSEVKHSTHIPMGDVLSVLLIAAGYGIFDILELFSDIRNNSYGKKERHMLNQILRKNHARKNIIPDSIF